MSDFTVHTLDSAPDAARPPMEKAREGFGFVPNLIGIMADAPPVARAYLAIHEQVGATSLSAVEQQVVLLSTSFENGCGYCMAAHTGGALQAGADQSVVESLRSGEPLDDDRLEALRRFTRTVVRERGFVEDAEVQEFLDAGFERRQVLEVILGVTMKTLSNYVNHIAETPLDDALADFAWERPESAAAAAD